VHVKLWGTRGSVPTPTPETTRFGGNTPCVEVRTPDNVRLVLDAGIGLHWLGCDLLADGFARGGRAHVLITHTHWGHIQGLPFFPPMLSPDCSIHLYGCGGDTPFEDLLRRQMSRAYCPVPNFFDNGIGGRVTTTDIDEQPFQIGGTTVTPRQVNHAPGVPTLGFRLDHGDRSLAYIPDIEYLDDGHRRPALELADGVDLLIHDAHHASADYPKHRGRGHCSDVDAVELAQEAGVGKILLFHHHPDRDDDSLDGLVREHAEAAVPVIGAAEQTEYVLGST
jgi:phosphoribosyl 1,2-cyclic phosphodiesterase